MPRQVLAALVILAFSAVVANAQPTIEKTPIKRTPAYDGATMFNAYCATCHGLDAQGAGPAAKALVKAPADLTRISARNNGQFPETRVKRYIQGLDEVAAHGSRDMPMWGELFRSLDSNTALIRVQALSEFLKSIQK
jgi:mono/diheme cytochrome c family protein